jgi:hypothetical protein
MKRQALLIITGCGAKAFETYSSRGLLPFPIRADRWSDYSADDALKLAVMLRAAELTDLDSASTLARRVLPELSPLDPFGWCGDQPLYGALTRYAWPGMPDDYDARIVVAGRWQDIEPMARERIARVAEIEPGARMTSLLCICVTELADRLLEAAHDLGLPDVQVRPVPENLTGSPAWFTEREQARRALFRIKSGEGA